MCGKKVTEVVSIPGRGRVITYAGLIAYLQDKESIEFNQNFYYIRLPTTSLCFMKTYPIIN
jgi:hypothetical protein